MQGRLFPGVLVSVLRQLAREQRTGLLHLSRDPDPLDLDWRNASREKRALVFVRGEIACAESNARGEQLGPRLLRAGLVTAAQLDAARDRQEAGACRLVTALLQEGAGRDDLRTAIAAQVEEIVCRGLQWAGGAWTFEPRAVAGAEPAGATTRQILLRALRRVEEPRAIREILGDRALPVVPRVTPAEVVTMGLGPMEGYVLTRADGSTSADDVLRLAPGDPQQAERALVVLLGLGLLERSTVAPGAKPTGVRPPSVRDVVEETRPVAPAPPPPPVPEPARAAAATGWGYAAPAPRPAPAAPARAAAPKPAAPAAQPERLSPAVFRRLVNDTWRGYDKKSHYEFLGVSRTATLEEIEAAYNVMAGRFRPDTNRDPSLHDLRDKLVTLYLQAGEAHGILADPDKRARYDADLHRREYERAVAERQVAAVAAAAAEAESTALQQPRVPEGDLWIRRAEELIAQQAWWDAIRVLEEFQPIAEGAWLRKCRLLLAGAYLRNPKWARQAEGVLRPLLEQDPNDVDALVLAARSCRGWARPRAASMLERALRIRPDHGEAQAELQSLQG